MQRYALFPKPPNFFSGKERLARGRQPACHSGQPSVPSASVHCAECVRTVCRARPHTMPSTSVHDKSAVRTRCRRTPHMIRMRSAHQCQYVSHTASKTLAHRAENELKTAPSVSRPVCKIIGIMINRIFKKCDISSLGIGIWKAVYASIFGCLYFNIWQITLRHSDVYASTFGSLCQNTWLIVRRHSADYSPMSACSLFSLGSDRW